MNHTPDPDCIPQQFHHWEPEATVRAGDIIVYIEITDQLARTALSSTTNHRRLPWRNLYRILARQNFPQKLAQLWQSSYKYQTRRVAVVCGITGLLLLSWGTVLFRLQYPGISWRAAFSATSALLLEGYSELFGTFELTTPIPWWSQLFSLGLTLAGTAFVGVLYALLTEALLTSRFEFFTSRPLVPQQDHIVLIGLNWVGQQVAALQSILITPTDRFV